jgi:hypothetical protein
MQGFCLNSLASVPCRPEGTSFAKNEWIVFWDASELPFLTRAVAGAAGTYKEQLFLYTRWLSLFNMTWPTYSLPAALFGSCPLWNIFGSSIVDVAWLGRDTWDERKLSKCLRLARGDLETICMGSTAAAVSLWIEHIGCYCGFRMCWARGWSIRITFFESLKRLNLSTFSGEGLESSS